MSNVVPIRRKPKVVVVEPKEPPMLELAELYALREEANERGDLVRVAEIERMVRELIDGCDY
jgi:hypothetical protein